MGGVVAYLHFFAGGLCCGMLLVVCSFLKIFSSFEPTGVEKIVMNWFYYIRNIRWRWRGGMGTSIHFHI